MRYSSRFPCAAAFLTLAATMPAAGAEYSLKPSVTLHQEYTDNVFQSEADKRKEFITRVLPRLALLYQAPFWDIDASYALDYRYYARDSRDDEITHNVDAGAKLRLIDNFLFLDVLESFKRVSLDPNRDRTSESLFYNQADQNLLTVEPYIRFSPGSQMTVTSGYRFRDTRYTNSSGIDKQEHGAYAVASREATAKLTTTAHFDYAYVETGAGVRYNQLMPTLGVNYQYATDSFISLQGGYSWFLYVDGPSSGSPYWNAALKHSFDVVTASFDAAVKYNTDPLRSSTEERSYRAKLERALHTGSASLYTLYSEFWDNREERLLSTRFGLGGNLKRELTEKLEGHLDLSGEKVRNRNGSDFTPPYRLYAAAGVNYRMVDNLTLSLDYIYVTYRRSLDSSDNSIEINRALMGVSKTF